MSQYGSVEYWNERYSKEENGFEWYHDYAIVKEHLDKILKKDSCILIIGCGNSNLSEDMFRDGFTDITSCDYSPVVIQKMREKCIEKTGLKWNVVDIQHMTYADASFDAVVDKGTLDAVICGDESTCDPDKVVAEVFRVLKKNGIYVCITYGTPDFRMDYFQKNSLAWKITHIPIYKPTVPNQPTQPGSDYAHHIYICRKSE